MIGFYVSPFNCYKANSTVFFFFVSGTGGLTFGVTEIWGVFLISLCVPAKVPVISWAINITVQIPLTNEGCSVVMKKETIIRP